MSEAGRTIKLDVPMITRLEGEGALTLSAHDGVLDEVTLKIYEPPRFFEKFVEGKHYSELPHLVARICGICPIAYQMTAVRAIEKVFGIQPPAQIQALRRVTQCGEWLQSHILHSHFLALPDYLGFDHVIAMAKVHPEVVKRALKLQALGNQLLCLQGGRSVHPVGLKVGGYGAMPKPERIAELLPLLEEAEQQTLELARWLADLALPEDHQDFISVACGDLSAPDGEYPLNEGDILVSDGEQIPPEHYRDRFFEYQEPHSTALFSHYQDNQGNRHPYLVGPLARLNLNFHKLPVPVKQLAAELDWQFPSQNMYHSIRARALESYFTVLEAKRILNNYPAEADLAAVDVTPRAGWAAHVTEAPRGLIYHHYQVDEEGFIKAGCIIPPTSQNQARIEQDLITSVNRYGLHHSDEELKQFCERLIRNYDPCISCSVHFLDLTVKRN